ncbi:MAG: HAD family hydrolase [Burkholderiales bacterium]
MKSLALFDLDHTLLSGDSDHAWGHFLVEQGIVQGDEHRQRNEAFWQQYKDGTLDINAYLQFALAPIAGKSDPELAGLRTTFMQDKIEPMISAAALRLLDKHAGELRAIVTATNAFVTKPIAQRFGVDHLIACEVEMVAGRYTGNPVGVPSFREGKVARVDAWLASMELCIEDFETSWFYSDSLNDLPLLKRVNHPVAVNPDPTLRRFALEQGWPVLDLMSEES